MDTDPVTKHVDLNTSDPALISPTTAHVPPPPTKELLHEEADLQNNECW